MLSLRDLDPSGSDFLESLSDGDLSNSHDFVTAVLRGTSRNFAASTMQAYAAVFGSLNQLNQSAPEQMRYPEECEFPSRSPSKYTVFLFFYSITAIKISLHKKLLALIDEPQIIM